MMQTCASVAELRGGGPILNRGWIAMFRVGLPPPRIVIGGLRSSVVGRRSLMASLGSGSRRRAQDNPLRHVAGGCQAPQANEQLPGQSHDHALTRRAPAIRG